MKKLLVSLMALSVLSFGAAANAGSISSALNNAANKINQKEQQLTNSQKEAAKKTGTASKRNPKTKRG